ncbi:MAG: hypothetical protein U9O66_01530 [Patescibacteria group bacterium]|nr:hypothetical protein [Patescibacteria group bacterium]
MNQNFYRAIFLKPLKLVLKNKFLWVLGLFALFLAGDGYDFISTNFSEILTNRDSIIWRVYDTGLFQPASLVNLQNIISADPLAIVASLLILIFIISIFFLFIWLSVISQGGIVYSIFKLNNKEKIGLARSIKIGRNNFWQILNLNIINKSIVWSVSFLFGLFYFAFLIKNISFFAWFLISIIFILIILFVSLITKYALSFIILQKKNYLSAIKAGFNLFLNNWVVTIETIFFLFIVNFIAQIAIKWIILILLLPISSMGVFSIFLSNGVSFAFLFIFIPILTSLIALWILAILIAYNYTVWISIFIKLTNKEKQISLIGKLFNKIKYYERKRQ